MKESELIVSVIVPLVIGPLFVFFKSLWDRYNIRKDQIKKIKYDENITIIREQLNNFYWPVLIKLKCLNHLNYEEIKAENVDLQEIFLNDSMSETQEKQDLSINRRKKRKKGKICGNTVIINGDFTICSNIVINPDIYTYCQKCEMKKGKKMISEYSDSDGDNLIQKRKSILNDQVKIDIDNLEWDNEIETNKSPKKVKINVVDDTSGTSSSSKKSSDSDIVEVEKLTEKTIKIEKLLKHELDHKIITLSTQIKEIIENNISIIKPNKKLGKELVKFIRFVETLSIIDNYNHKKKEIKKKFKTYNYRDLGVTNNTKKLIRILVDNLNLLLEEEQNIKQEFIFNYTVPVDYSITE
tara:strand:+ start:2306 stop:3367 length:1062 start_codon:yes stop_codon:yes gene_type:complete